MWDLSAATSPAAINIFFTHDKINKSFPSPSLSAECFSLALAYSLPFLKEYSEIQRIYRGTDSNTGTRKQAGCSWALFVLQTLGYFVSKLLSLILISLFFYQHWFISEHWFWHKPEVYLLLSGIVVGSCCHLSLLSGTWQLSPFLSERKTPGSSQSSSHRI